MNPLGHYGLGYYCPVPFPTLEGFLVLAAMSSASWESGLWPIFLLDLPAPPPPCLVSPSTFFPTPPPSCSNPLLVVALMGVITSVEAGPTVKPAACTTTWTRRDD